jgi:hypothetical protein
VKEPVSVWAWMRGLAPIVTLALGATPLAAHAGRIWYEQGLATVTVGYDLNARQYTHRKFYAVAYGPEGLPGAAHDAARGCTRTVTSRVGEDMRVALWRVKEPKPAGGYTSAEEAERDKSTA